MDAHKPYKEYKFLPGTHLLVTPGSRETIVDKMPCLRAYAPSGIRTHGPLITSREHEPLHYSIDNICYCCLMETVHLVHLPHLIRCMHHVVHTMGIDMQEFLFMRG